VQTNITKQKRADIKKKKLLIKRVHTWKLIRLCFG